LEFGFAAAVVELGIKELLNGYIPDSV